MSSPGPDARPAPVSRRNRPAKSALSQVAIVQAALEIVRQDGVEAMTVRRVGQALDTGSASLYVYIDSREHLLELVLDQVQAEVALPEPDAGRWQAQLVVLVSDVVAAYARHLGVAGIALGAVPIGSHAVALIEAQLGCLRAGGIDDATAAYAVDLLALYAASVGVEHDVARRFQARGESPTAAAQAYEARIVETFAALDARQFPNLTRLGPLMTRGSRTDRFRFGLQVLLDGLVDHRPVDDDEQSSGSR
jgi:AcrR family transcriptional regulator